MISSSPSPSAGQLAAILENLGTSVFRVNGDGRFLDGAPNLEKIIGFPAAELGSVHKLVERVHDTDAIQLQRLRECLASQTAFDENCRILCRDGTLKWIRLSGQPYGGPDGERYFDVFVEAIKKQEAILPAETITLLLRSLNASRTTIWDWTVGSPTINMIRPSDHIDDPNWKLTVSIAEVYRDTHPADREDLRAAIAKAVKTGEPYSFEYRTMHAPDDPENYEWVWATGFPRQGYINGQRRTLYLSGITTIITAKKRLEEAKSLFVATLSHEFRTPVSGILGMLELLRDTPLNRQQIRYMDTIITASSSLLSMINDLLDFSKIEAGKLNIEKIDYDIEQLIEESTSLFHLTAEKKGLDFQVAVDPATPLYFSGDPCRIRQVLVNLINNAFKFTATGAVRVRVSMRQEKNIDRLYFEVQDTGTGIKEQALKKLFNPYNQADSSTARRFGGTGLGLSICRELTQLMGGDIGVDSEEGSGSTFWFTVEANPARNPPEKKAPALIPSYTQFDLKVLVAEDNPVNKLVVETMLKKHGIQPDSVINGTEAVERCKGTDFDLILIDYQMPELDGVEASRQIRALEAKKPSGHHAHIIALTASAGVSYQSAFKSAGIDGYLPKPISKDKLNTVLSQVMQNKTRGAP